MPARLVYAPKAWVYTKDSSGNLYNLSNYVTAGNVQRLINQASTASITLRNPDKIFTTPGPNGGGSAFHPMDPITIYLERLAGFPVRVFTGYLDDTPYYQMYPGTITLNATCTLKRLLYTWFDPSLPYVIGFLQSYGWTSTQSGAVISLPNATSKKDGVTQPDVANGAQAFGGIKDGSFGKLLWATLYNLADWHDSQIYIEPIPQDLPARIATLMTSFQAGEQTAAAELTSFLAAVMGTGGQGSGGGTGTGGTGGTGGSTAIPSGAQADSNSLISYLTAHNYSVNAAAGIAGNIGGGEDGNWSCATLQGGAQSDTCPQDGTTGYGLVQWTSANYQSQLHRLAVSMGQKDSSVAVQYAMIVQSLPASLVSAMNAAPTPAAAALIFETQYERHAGPPQQARQDAATKYASEYTSSNASNKTLGVTPNLSTAVTTQTGSTGAASQGGKSTSTKGTLTRFDAIVKAANTIDSANLPYAYGGGHGTLGVPSQGQNSESGGVTSGPIDTGFDCSGCVSAVLGAAGLMTSPETSNAIHNGLGSAAVPGIGMDQNAVNIFESGGHTFMQIAGRFFGTADNSGDLSDTSSQGAGWIPKGQPPSGGDWTTYHIDPARLNENTVYSYTLAGGTGNTTLPANAGSAATDVVSQSNVEAFAAQLNFPSVMDEVTALALGTAHKGLMHDQSLMPFVQQLAQGSMRSFMSLPNGDFYAFYPDYFGELGQHNAYWLIDDIEVTNGGINLSDASLVTHYFAVGDNTWPAQGTSELLNDLISSGAVTIYDAFLSADVVDTSTGVSKKATKDGLAAVMQQAEASKFIQRYGARPLVNQYPQVRSSIMEMFLAYQGFMQAWANQFLTPFEFTFMPELFPGGKVGFPKHGIQMYIQSVTHSWNLAEGGFTTTAQLNAPSLMPGVTSATHPDLPPFMVQALVEPVRNLTGIINEHKTRTNQQVNTTPNTTSSVTSPSPFGLGSNPFSTPI